jgi:hypothetical protein
MFEDYTGFEMRVVKEKEELDVRLKNLIGFFDTPVFQGLGRPEQDRLILQYQHMSGYSTVLAARIAAFGD